MSLVIEEILPYSPEWLGITTKYKTPSIPLWVIEEHVHLRIIKVDGSLYCLFHGSSGLKAYTGLFLLGNTGLELVGEKTWNGLDEFSRMDLSQRIEHLMSENTLS